MGPALLLLALEFHRAPIRFRHLTDPRKPLPDAFGDWLVESSAALAPARISATAESLGTRPEALREAFLFLLRQVLLTPRADHYRVLGLSRLCTIGSIKRHHSLLVRMFHPDRLPEGDERGVTLTARINIAYRVLRDAESRGRYDRSLPALGRSRHTQGDAVGFFRAREPAEPLVWRPQPPVGRRRWPRPRLHWLLAGIPIAALVLFVLEEPSSPMLRVDPEHADQASFGPSYLQGAGGGGRAEAPATGPVAGPATRSDNAAGTSDQRSVGAEAWSGPGQVRPITVPSASETPQLEPHQGDKAAPEFRSPVEVPEDSNGDPLL